ncbi:peptide methionine sulfoxide reductase isoform X2 [Nilaparvata lugens]|uniref:peptide methionine sulfoxide reductase isoform X2 n=1 Tax=Nilaparvata lugens TaxID=108931 RepID=UPI000B982AD8|nr:peptide methionine sulfoxide reductase isoform X2 [Nilaparvata lugens]
MFCCKKSHPSKNMSTYVHNMDVPTKKATFGMACFWAPDALYGATIGVIRTRVGYCGGTKNNPTYRSLPNPSEPSRSAPKKPESEDEGDHTEAIDIDYDPNVITYAQLLELFWQNHDPTARNKLQYTSIIFYHDEDQKEAADKTLKEQQKRHKAPIVTKVIPFKEFFDAEDYHQKYRLQQHPWLCSEIGVGKTSPLLKTSHLAARLNGYIIGQGGVAQFNREADLLGLQGQVKDYVSKLVAENEGNGLIC